LGEERHHAVGDDDGGPAGGDGVQPALVSHVGADDVGVGVHGDKALARGGDSGEVDVVPVHGGWEARRSNRVSSPAAKSRPTASAWRVRKSEATWYSFLARRATLRMRLVLMSSLSYS
jgi:hypothetical protein